MATRLRFRFLLVVWSFACVAPFAHAETASESGQQQSTELAALRQQVQTLPAEVDTLRAQYAERLGGLEAQMTAFQSSLAVQNAAAAPEPAEAPGAPAMRARTSCCSR